MLLKIDQAFKTSNGVLVTETVDGGRRAYIPFDVLEEMFDALGVGDYMTKLQEEAVRESLGAEALEVKREYYDKSGRS